MKKKIIITILIIALFMVSCQKVDYDQLKIDFDNLLIAGNFEAANTLYTTAQDERIEYYKHSLNEYATVLIDNAINNLPPDEAKAALGDFLIFEFTKPSIQLTIDSIVAKEQAIAQSNASYLDGMNLFFAREFDMAHEKLGLVESFDENYQSAQDTIALLNARTAVWESAVADNLSGRHTSVNSLAYSQGYVYFPVDINNIHSIVKHNYVSGETAIFPIIEFEGIFHINGINVIGDYIYFTAGENLGKGLMFDTPYNIYEMKTDGTELTMIKSGDYFDLLFKKDTFYALSYTKGLVKMDKELKTEEIISNKGIIEMQLTDNGLYYVEKIGDEHNSSHILYLYKDGQSAEIMQKELLHVYFFGSYSLYYHDSSNNLKEELFIADMNVQNSTRLAILQGGSIGDMYELIGSLDDKVMLNTAGWLQSTTKTTAMRQKIYAELQISNKRMAIFQSQKIAPAYEVVNVLYEEGVMLVKDADNTYSLTSTPSGNSYNHVITIPQHDAATLDVNMSIVSENRPGDDDFYSQDEVVVEMDNFWYYSSPTLNISIERVFDESIETVIFVASIRTKEPSGFNIGYSNLEVPGVKNVKTDDIAQVNNAIFATNGDFAMHSGNVWSGKVIREGRIFDAIPEKGIREYDVEKVYDYNVNCDDYLVMYPNGEMVAYTDKDEITYGQLLEAGVENMLSFGPILVRDNQKTSASTDPSYYISGANPRCAWGMVEPGHYIAIVADGRQPGKNRGMTFYSMSDYFQDLGCSVAYNLDGGQTAAMTFMGRFVNTHQFDNDGKKWVNHRNVWEIIYFGTSDLVPYDLENYYEK